MIRNRMSDTVQYVDDSGIPEAEPIAEGVWLLAGRPRHAVNIYVIGDVLVDAGTRHSARRIRRQVGHLSLSAHVLTHGHMDHMGASHEICEEFDLPLLCGEADVAAVESGGRLGLDERPVPIRLEHRLVAGQGHRVSHTLKEGETVAGFSVLEVPGHSPGHLAFWRENDRVLIMGDVLFNVLLPRLTAGLRLPPAALTSDPETNLESARRLARLEPEIVCFGHGPPLRDPEQLQQFIAGAAL